jgi:hypothetical protein
MRCVLARFSRLAQLRAGIARQVRSNVRRKSGQCQEAVNAITVEQQTGLVIPSRYALRSSKRIHERQRVVYLWCYIRDRLMQR